MHTPLLTNESLIATFDGHGVVEILPFGSGVALLHVSLSHLTPNRRVCVKNEKHKTLCCVKSDDDGVIAHRLWIEELDDKHINALVGTHVQLDDARRVPIDAALLGRAPRSCAKSNALANTASLRRQQ